MQGTVVQYTGSTPILNIYIHELPKILYLSFFTLFADYSAISVSENNYKIVLENSALSFKNYLWVGNVHPSLNMDKTVEMFSSGRCI